jgi:hypothetical protein
MKYPETAAAARKAEKSLWAVGDALLQEIPWTARNVESRLVECAAELKQQGIVGVLGNSYTVRGLQTLRQAAYRFKVEDRKIGGMEITPHVAQAAGSPAMMQKAIEAAAQEGVPVTERVAAKVRKGAHHAVKRAERHVPKPERKNTKEMRSSAAQVPAAEARRHANVLGISTLADKAIKLGEEFTMKIAVEDLTDDEIDELTADVDRVIDAWQLARQAVVDPMVKQVERFLAS